MPRFSIRNPYLILVLALAIVVVGVTSLARMPVDLFPVINMPEVVVATFYNGMPPEDIETEITGRFERFFTLGSGIEHIESRSLPGVSIIKIFFQPGTSADSDVTMISNLAMANLRRLPPGTLPPVVLKFDASSLPVCLVTLKGLGLSETTLHDLGQFEVRDQLASVAGASVPPPFGGKYRQIMVYTDPLKLQAYNLSPMSVVRAVNNANLILPAGDAKIGPFDYNIYTNSQISHVKDIDSVPLKTVGQKVVTVGDIGSAQDASTIQTNIVRIDGQRSVYLPILKQGGETNTIAVVQGVKNAIAHLSGVPHQLVAKVVFDQSQFVRTAIHTVLVGALLGLVLTCLMVLLFLGSASASTAVLLSVPLSSLATFVVLYFFGSSVNSMVLGGIALAFSRLIYNIAVVLENIYRHVEQGMAPAEAAELGGNEVARPVLAATLATGVVFFPVTFLYGVSRFLFSALALAVVISLIASYFIALTIVPLFCARYLRPLAEGERRGWLFGIHNRFNAGFQGALRRYERWLNWALDRPRTVVAGTLVLFAASLALFPLLGVAFFPRTDSGQFVINLKAPSGLRVEDTNQLVARVENVVRQVIPKSELGMIVSNIGVTPGFSSIYTSNSGPHTATIQVELKSGHKTGTYTYMRRLRGAIAQQVPQVSTFFQTGGMENAVLNMGLPAPIDVQVSGSNLGTIGHLATGLAQRFRKIPSVSQAYIPQSLDYPALRLSVNRQHASELGLNQRGVVDNVITALTSNSMIAPSYWIDPRTGNDYMLTVQYPESKVHSLSDLESIPLRVHGGHSPAVLGSVARITRLNSPTEVDHYQIQRVVDVYVNPSGEDLGRVANRIDAILKGTHLPAGVQVHLRGMVRAMRASFRSFGLGLLLALLLLYLVLVPLFKSFLDPLLALLSVPLGLTGVLLTLLFTATTLNVMSLMGVVMLVGIAVANSILIVDFVRECRSRGDNLRESIVGASVIRLRPILMISLATVFGLLPMALKLGAGAAAYAPLAVAIIGGLAVSFISTLFTVPAALALAYRKHAGGPASA